MSKGKQKDKIPHYTDNLYCCNERVKTDFSNNERWFQVTIDSFDAGYNKTYVPYLANHMTVLQWKNVKRALYHIIDQINDEFNIGPDEEY